MEITFDEMLEDAWTHGVRVSEVEEQYKDAYTQYLQKKLEDEQQGSVQRQPYLDSLVTLINE